MAEEFKTDQPCLTVCWTNISKDMDDFKLRKFFGSCGGIEKIHFPRHPKTDKFLGFVHVKFYVQIGADRAVKMSGENGSEVYFSDRSKDIKDEKMLWTKRNEAMKLCYGLINDGRCSRGPTCKFSHDIPAGTKPKGKCYAFAEGN